MSERFRGSAVLVCWGLLVVVGSAVLYDPRNHGGMAGGLRWLVVLLAFVVGAGLVGSSLLTWRRGRTSMQRTRLPAITLLIGGVVTIVASVPVLRPWHYDGLAGGLRVMALAGFAVGGVLAVLAGLQWYRTRNSWLPLMTFAVLTGAGAFYSLDSAGFLLGEGATLYVAVLLAFVVVPVVVLRHVWDQTFDGEPTDSSR